MNTFCKFVICILGVIINGLGYYYFTTKSLKPLDSINMHAYMGEWYYVASSPWTTYTFHRNTFCNTVIY